MKLLFLATVVLVAGLVVASAYGWRSPTNLERRGIVAAILDKQRQNGCHSYRTCHPHISDIRVSLANTRFARATLSVRGYRDAIALLLKLYESWRVADLSSSPYVGCAKAPKAVRVDLEIKCPGGK